MKGLSGQIGVRLYRTYADGPFSIDDAFTPDIGAYISDHLRPGVLGVVRTGYGNDFGALEGLLVQERFGITQEAMNAQWTAAQAIGTGCRDFHTVPRRNYMVPAVTLQVLANYYDRPDQLLPAAVLYIFLAGVFSNPDFQAN